MTRYLANALASDEIKFRHQLAKLEKKSGHNNHDIRLTSEMVQSVIAKINDLGLDPNDTTSEELFVALNHKLKTDDARLVKSLRNLAANKVNAAAEIKDGIKVLLEQLSSDTNVFVLKNSSLKKLIKTNPPKKTLKGLNYRSLDSLLKHEQLPMILLAINFYESSKYIANFYDKYSKFKATDFELRQIHIYAPSSSKWQHLLKSIEDRTGKQLISNYELGSLILLPMEKDLSEGLLSARLVLLISEISRIQTTSTYLKIHQVSPDFGKKLVYITEHEPMVEASMLGKNLPWQLVHTLLHKFKDIDLDIPHLSSEDLVFTSLLDKIGDIVADFKYWDNTSSLAYIKGGQTTSLNIIDVAVNLCNKLDFNSREIKHFKNSLWQELVKRYVDEDTIKTSLKTGDEQFEFEV